MNDSVNDGYNDNDSNKGMKQSQGPTPSMPQQGVKAIGNFEPSSQTKKLLYATRKKIMPIGVKLPGLFIADGSNGSDQKWVILAVFLELTGLIALCYALWEETSFSGVTVFFIGVVVVLADLFFAIIHHFSYAPLNCEIENEKLRILRSWRTSPLFKNPEKVIEIPYSDYLERIEFEIPPLRSFARFLSGLCIFLLCIAKAVVFTAHLPQNWPDQIKTIVLIPCLLSYFVVAWIHFFKTGYFIAWIRYIVAYGRDHKKFRSGQTVNLTQRTHSVIINLKAFVAELQELGYESVKSYVSHPECSIQIEEGLVTNLKHIGVRHQISHLYGIGPHLNKELESKSSQFPIDIRSKIGKLGAGQYTETVFRQHIQTVLLPNEFAQYGDAIAENAKSSESFRFEIFGRFKDAELEKFVEAQNEGLAKTAVALYGHYLQLVNLHS